MSCPRLIHRQPDSAAYSPPSRNLQDQGISRAKPLASWRRAGNSGHGIASQIADRVSGTFGLGEVAKGGGTFVLIQRRAGSPPATLGQSSSIWDTADAVALNRQATQLYNQG